MKNLAVDIGKRVTGTITSARNLGDVIDNLGSILRGLPDALRGAPPDTPNVVPAAARPDVDTYGLNPDGTPMTYANRSRPSYRVDTEPDVWANRTGEEMGPDTEWEPLPRTKPDGMSDANWNAWRADMNRQNWWDMGHTPGNEYRDLLDRYLAGEIDIREFRNEVNNPDNYHVEHPSSNRGGEYEATPRRR